MSGAAGHIQHLFENKNLTFKDIKDVLSQAASGKLQQVTEKLDGLNLMFTWNGELRVARNISDIKTFGINSEQLYDRFLDKPSITKAFAAGFNTIEAALDTLTYQQCDDIFDCGNTWYSVEVIYPEFSNTINYDANSIVFHGWPVISIADGTIKRATDDSGVEILSASIKKMQNAVSWTNWKVHGPVLVNLRDISEGTVLATALARLSDIAVSAGVEDNNTISDYILAKARNYASVLRIPKSLMDSLALRIAGVKGAPNVTQLSKAAGQHADIVQMCVENSEQLVKSWMKPIEQTISDFAVEILRGLKSSLVADTDAEVKRLQARVSKAISVIKSSGDKNALEVLQVQLEKLRSVENIASPMEGIVFLFKGNAYKFTGSFAAAHQILSLFRYGKNGVKFDEKLLDQ